MMDTEPWHIRRRKELEAVAPMKRKKVEAFVKVPLWWITAAAKHARSPATMVLIELLYASWKGAVQNYLDGGAGHLVGEFIEIESGRWGALSQNPEKR
jgi:hypothetical protein